MRISAALFAVLISFASVDAMADTVVRGGEHVDFSRVVIPEAPTGWAISSDGRALEIVLPGIIDYSIEDLTERRTAHRVLSAKLDVADGSSRLHLSLTCDCPTRAALSAEGSLIIDITDRGNPMAAGPAGTSPEKSTPEPENYEVARNRLIAVLQEANKNGVVTLKSDNRGVDAEGNPAVIAAPTPVSLEASVEGEAKVEPQQIGAGASCIDPGIILSKPDDDEIAYDDIVRFRTSLETSPEDPYAALTLAEAYLRLGFFEEAKAVADAQSPHTAEAAFASAIAGLVDPTTARRNPVFSEFGGCGIEFDVLALTADARFSGSAPTGFSIRHFEALGRMTASVREPLAEFLALAALDADEPELARRFYNMAKATDNAPATPALSVLNAALATTDDAAVDDYSALRDIARTRGPLQARALAEIAHTAMADRNDLPYDGYADDIQEFARDTDHRSDVELEAMLSGAGALAKSGRISDAIGLLRHAQEKSPQAEQRTADAASSIVGEALREGQPGERYEALAAVLRNEALISEPGVLALAAEDLAALGAYQLTEKIIARSDTIPASEKAAWIAKARLAAGLADLPSVSADDPSVIWAHLRAAERRRDDRAFGAAFDGLLRDSPDSETATEAGRAAWRMGDWRRAAVAFAKASPENLDDRTGDQFVLAALAGGQPAPQGASDAFADPDTASAISHLFASAPPFSARRLDAAAIFADGVQKEIDFMEGRLARE